MFDGSAKPPLPAASVPTHTAPEPLENALVQEWLALQHSQRHVADAVDKILTAWRVARSLITELEAQLAERDARISQLESERPTLVEPSDR